MSVMGSAWLKGTSANVVVWIDDSGKIEKEFYNFSDYTGNHPFRSLKKDHPLYSQMVALRLEARKNARAKLAYMQARTRNTSNEDLKYAWFVFQGRGGHTIHIDKEEGTQCRLEGYGLNDEEAKEVIDLGIPYIDSRTIPDDLITATISIPMVSLNSDPAPWGSMSYAPIAVVAAAYKLLGARVENIVPDFEGVKQIRSMAKHNAALAAYTSGGEVALGQLMIDWEKK